MRSLVGLGLFVALFSVAPVRAQHEHNSKCAKACADCALQCASCAAHCTHLVLDGKKDHAKTMRLCNDCAAICSVSGVITGRHGPLAVTLCESCAKACDTCGKACDEFKDDKHMADCAKACRDCAKACREMIEHSKH
jgi:hypothetical protein